MEFHKTEMIKGVPTSENFMENIKGILKNKTHSSLSHFW